MSPLNFNPFCKGSDANTDTGHVKPNNISYPTESVLPSLPAKPLSNQFKNSAPTFQYKLTSGHHLPALPVPHGAIPPPPVRKTMLMKAKQDKLPSLPQQYKLKNANNIKKLDLTTPLQSVSKPVIVRAPMIRLTKDLAVLTTSPPEPVIEDSDNKIQSTQIEVNMTDLDLEDINLTQIVLHANKKTSEYHSDSSTEDDTLLKVDKKVADIDIIAQPSEKIVDTDGTAQKSSEAIIKDVEKFVQTETPVLKRKIATPIIHEPQAKLPRTDPSIVVVPDKKAYRLVELENGNFVLYFNANSNKKLLFMPE